MWRAKMKITTLLISLVLSLLLVPSIVAQETVPVSIEDLKQFRKALVDRDAEKARADEAEKQRDYWKGSAANWENLFRAEKARADGIQESRIQAVKDAVSDLQKANKLLHDQREDDKKKIGELTAENIKLRSSRKWWFAAGAITGGAAGTFVGYKLGNKTITIPGLNQNVSQFKFSLTF
jgi:hypothetical protein